MKKIPLVFIGKRGRQISRPTKKLSIEWCNICESFFVRCPRCGNNSCNAGRGREKNGRWCIKCSEIGELDQALSSNPLIDEMICKLLRP